MTLHTGSLLFAATLAIICMVFSGSDTNTVEVVQLYCLAFIMNVVATKWT